MNRGSGFRYPTCPAWVNVLSVSRDAGRVVFSREIVLSNLDSVAAHVGRLHVASKAEEIVELLFAAIAFVVGLASFAGSVYVLVYASQKFGPDVGIIALNWRQALALMLCVRLCRPVPIRSGKKDANATDAVSTALFSAVRVSFMFAVLWVI